MRFVASSLFLLTLFVSGCAEQKATVTGALLENGKPMGFGMNQAAVQLTLVSPDGKLDNRHSYTAVVGEDGTFEVVASGGQLPLGNYQVGVMIRGKDSKYKGLEAPESPIRRELKGGKNEIIVDVAKPQG